MQYNTSFDCYYYRRLISLNMRKKSRSDKTGSSRLKDRISDMEVDYMKKIGILIMTLIMIIAMSTTSFAFGISASQAEKTALKSAHLSKSKVRSLEVEKDDNGKIFEVEFIRKSNKAEYEFKICASNGRIIKKNIDYKYKPVKSDKKIGKKAAMKKVARSAHVKYSVVRKGRCKIEKTGKEWKYEISFKKGKYKFEYDIPEELKGTEVKSVRMGRINIKDSWCSFKYGQIFANNVHIRAYEK